MSVDLPKQGAILIVDDTPMNLEVLVKELTDQNFEIFVAIDGESALEQLRYTRPDIILLDVMMPGIDGFETCSRLKNNPDTKDIPVIFMTALADTLDKVKGFEAGAVDYVTKPIEPEEVSARVKTHLTIQRLQAELREANAFLEQRVAERTAELEALKNRLQDENVYLQEEIKLQHNFEEIISQSDAYKKVLNQVEQVAATDATVLILGETGTGKELIARAIHTISARKDRPLIKVNCAALPTTLIESELFGHEKGAFTGALARRNGRFELADRETIFLDEIGDLPLELQAKLLRALQEGEFERLGGAQTIRVDVRVIAATNRNLEQAIKDGNFREDLYYRLNVFPITLPPLRERPEDIPLLVRFFVNKFSKKLGKQIDAIPRNVMTALRTYRWPGNVRELENLVERAVILARDLTLTFDGTIVEQSRSDAALDSIAEPNPKPSNDTIDTLEVVERHHICRVLEETNWVIEGKNGAALLLGLNPNTLRSRMKKLGIRRPPRNSS
ncbi:MAG: transcriptional regulator [Candidatus Entotheonella factor]|uniref:Transcriptional regulator n=1 Tax=Entotheonella factor TaxID=1429438 RepID=W4L980_ENTF1|nr:MAG: transcriptional regulator [Candidatus Entotheonella factor]